ncbi:hypothetical protein DPMN_041458 [Dreissena polymorpha]|uniref:Uncharacterized protein n=1 Tax=Dreissena polymorpha TaxID=45954 RepID=A0A9D4CWY9_DREPO|nr:hypothetical protein DPMN_041458 [Dreissena polymorpha]
MHTTTRKTRVLSSWLIHKRYRNQPTHVGAECSNRTSSVVSVNVNNSLRRPTTCRCCQRHRRAENGIVSGCTRNGRNSLGAPCRRTDRRTH